MTQFIAAIYWATTTITTIGYGDITPTSTAERVVAMIVMLLGGCYTAVHAQLSRV